MPCRAASTMHPGVHSALCDCLAPYCADCGTEDREVLSLVGLPNEYMCSRCEEKRAATAAERKSGADTHCNGCKGTGTLVGFGSKGQECRCVARCLACDVVIVWAHDDERAPQYCDDCAFDGVREEAAQ